MRVWLDDERDPTNQTTKRLFGSVGDEVWVKTAQEAIDLIATGQVTYISLDHDLGHQEAGTGLDVAKFIEEKAFNKEIPKLHWRVHSMNLVGQSNISTALRKADEFWDR